MKSKTMNSGFNSTEGSILMETILVLPLFIAVFSGVFLVGDLAISRARLHASDRAAAWNAGNRHQSIGDLKRELTKWFFPAEDFGPKTKISEARQDTETHNTWSHFARGTAILVFTTPDWTAGWRKGALRIMADIGSSPDQNQWDAVSMPNPALTNSWRHTALMRKAYDGRENSRTPEFYAAQGNPNWYKEYQLPFFNASGTAEAPERLSGVSVTPEYIRNANYVTWSE